MAAPPLAGMTQLPEGPAPSCPLCPKPKVHVAPASCPAQANVPGEEAGRQARGEVPSGPARQMPGLLPPSRCSGRVQASPADFPVQASTTAGGGVWLLPQKRVLLARAVMQLPSKLWPWGPVAEQLAPEAFPVQALTRKLGGGGKLGTQATPAPSRVARQLPGKLKPPSRLPVSEQVSPTALPEQASSIEVDGAQRRGPVLARVPASDGVL